ncbi:MAG: hypothetical protein Q8O31_03160 [Rhodocyclaceae bacterium]|nr:hypothetical protein [Rhodocyclaceae bacterium]
MHETLSAKSVNIMAYSWKTHVLLDGVDLGITGQQNQTTQQGGTANLTGITNTSLSLSVIRNVPTGEVTTTGQAVNLQDAISILKMIVGLEVNGAGKALSPYQAYAADFDGNGAVHLTDAIGVLKHVVGLSAPTPNWLFFSESDALTGRAGTAPGSAPVSIVADLTEAASEIPVGLVGVLRGDVDGSFAGISGVKNLDVLQPDYIQNVVAQNGFDATQFGVYSG